ncbi:methyl-accepting chemotaxis protein [Acidisoma sp. 7E03]
MLKRLSITSQFTLLGSIGVLITLIVITINVTSTYSTVLQAKQTQVRNIVDAAVSMTESYVARAKSGEMTTAQAQREARTAIGAIRYDHGNYLFVYDYQGMTLVHATKSYIGLNRYDAKDPYGTPTTQPMIDSAKQGTPTFHRYFIPKAGGTVPQPKISYAVAVPEWQWVVGSGLYVDDVRQKVIGDLQQIAVIVVPLFLIFLAVIYGLRRGVARLLAGLTQSMEAIARGAFDTLIPGLDRRDELGRMAAALAVFRDASLEKQRLERETEAARAAAAEERARAEAERAERAAQQTQVVTSLASGLERLSVGDLVFRLAEPFTHDYEKLRQDFNAAMDKLQETMGSITQTTSGVRSGAGEIAQAADDLSRRTEQQAAGLEETAAALDEITMAVRKTAEGAQEARTLVSQAKTDAEISGKVVHDAIGAMSSIEESSKQIGTIVTLIDEIAFQTNLLALNAGVEAARAGEAGRGFAVVATEVRALAQRSADAAREIKTLIATAGQQVETGVKLVDETGHALARIVEQVAQLNDFVADIAASAREQATGLSEVNSAVNQMDQVTQQNAAMVEQATAASHGMMQEAETLNRLIAQFRIGRDPVEEESESPRAAGRRRRAMAL